jgi:hypothetical protein
MPIVKTTPTTPQAAEPSIRITAPEYRGVTVDTRYTPRKALQAYITGSAYTVDYFSQVIDADSGLSGQQLNRDATNQQYRLVKRFELKVTAAPDPNQDDESNKMFVIGTANVYSDLIPNVGDMFLGDVGDGQEGVFQVTASRKKTTRKDTTYEIDFQMVDYSTPERRADFIRKTIQTTVFVKNMMTYYANPFIELEDFAIMEQLGGIANEIMDAYFKTFVSNEYKTLVVPDQEQLVYDPFLTASVLSLFDTYDTPELRYIRKLNCDGDPVMKVTTIWDALLKRSTFHLKRACTRAGMLGIKYFNSQAMLEGVYFSGMQYVMYPIDPQASINARELIDMHTVNATLQRRSDAQDTDHLPLIPKVADTDYYVFSEAFYTQATEGQSKLEVLTYEYLEEKALDVRVLLEIAQSYLDWEPIEQFYLAPVLLLLIKMTVRGL